MVAWMHSVEERAGRATPPRPARSTAALPAEAHQPVIAILATMVLASVQERVT
jgi:hypothetical protein